jgi:urocanate hydratase
VSNPRIVRSPRGNTLHCKNWVIEAAFRMIQNNLDPEVAEHPESLVVYGGIGKAARNWESFESILKSLENLSEDETLLVQSGKPVGILRTHTDAPRVLIANSNLVPKWATWEHFRHLESLGLIMFGQMTAGSWIYIGTQGILQGTYETFAACGRKHFSSESTTLPLLGRVVLTGGLGGMGGAQPLAVKIAGGICLCIDVDESRVEKRLETSYLDFKANNLDHALKLVEEYKQKKQPVSIGLVGNIVTILKELVQRKWTPDVLTDQTSAHDPLNGYIPEDYSLSEAILRRKINPEIYIQESLKSMSTQIDLMLTLKERGAVVFDYGNNLRGMAKEFGNNRSFEIPGFVPEYIRPMFCEGNGPFRWVALSGNPEDIYVTDRELLKLFPENINLKNWLSNGAPKVQFQGLPARICWLRHRERAQAGLLFNNLVKSGAVSAPIVIGRDHLDCGSVASPYRETEAMKDGSDAISDWPLLNALVNTSCGASWVSLHHGGGVGMGYSQHSGMVIVADGTEDAARRITRTLEADPAMGVFRHADAGYDTAVNWADTHQLKIPLSKK